MNKLGGFTDMFLLIIVSFVIVVFAGIFIYFGGEVQEKVTEEFADMENLNTNTTQLIEETIGEANQSYQALHWISIFLIFGMIISIFIGSYLVTTKPIFLLPYIIILIVAVIVAVGMSNAYETIIANPTLSDTFSGFAGSNWILLNLPFLIAGVGLVGGIIMFSRIGSKQEVYYGS